MRCRRLGRRLPCAVGLSLLTLGPTAAVRAQESGPIVFGEQQQKRKWFALENTHFTLEGLYRYQNDETTPKNGGEKTSFTDSHFEETLSLSSTGYIYHPNLVDLA